MRAFLIRHIALLGVVMLGCGILGILLGETMSGIVMCAFGLAWLITLMAWRRMLDSRMIDR